MDADPGRHARPERWGRGTDRGNIGENAGNTRVLGCHGAIGVHAGNARIERCPIELAHLAGDICAAIKGPGCELKLLRGGLAKNWKSTYRHSRYFGMN